MTWQCDTLEPETIAIMIQLVQVEVALDLGNEHSPPPDADL